MGAPGDEDVPMQMNAVRAGEDEDNNKLRGEQNQNKEMKGEATADTILTEKEKIDANLQREVATARKLQKQIQALKVEMAKATAETNHVTRRLAGSSSTPA